MTGQQHLEVLRLLSAGTSVRQASRVLGVSERSTARLIRAACDELGVETPIEAVVAAVRAGLI